MNCNFVSQKNIFIRNRNNNKIKLFNYNFVNTKSINFVKNIISYNINLNFNSNGSFKIERYADIVTNIYLEIDIQAKNTNIYWSWIKHLGTNIFDYFGFYLDDIEITKYTNINNNILLSINNDNNDNHFKTINGDDNNNIRKDYDIRKTKIIVPLYFFFNNYNTPLYLLLLQKSVVSIKFKTKNYEHCINRYRTGNNSIDTWELNPEIKHSKLCIEYIALPQTERMRIFKNSSKITNESFEYNITKRQHIELPKILTSMEIDEITDRYYFDDLIDNIKYLYWIVQLNKYVDGSYFLAESLERATKRFILMTICNYNLFISTTTQSAMLSSSFNISSSWGNSTSSIFIHSSDFNNNSSEWMADPDIELGILYHPGTTFIVNDNGYINAYSITNKLIGTINIETKLNTKYKYFDNIKKIIENCYITKSIKIKSDIIDILDYSYIKVNKLLDSYTYSLKIDDLITSSIDDLYPFQSFTRSTITGGVSLEIYDLKLYDYNNYSLYLDETISPITSYKIFLFNLNVLNKLDNKGYSSIWFNKINHDIKNPLLKNGINLFKFNLDSESKSYGSADLTNSNIKYLEFEKNDELTNKNKATIYFFAQAYKEFIMCNGKGGFRYN